MTKYLVTAALPYANGPIHFGHLAGVYLPADIYVRHRRAQGHCVRFICGSDEHGVSIMLSAEKAGTPYQEYVDQWHKEHKELMENFGIRFDIFGRTSASYHEKETVRWFQALYKAGLIKKQEEKQLFCIDDNKFLTDRMARGTCYVCHYEEARGDECPNCGEWIEATKLIHPYSKISGSKNVEVRTTENYFLLLSEQQKNFETLFKTRPHWKKIVKGFVKGFLEKGLRNRSISRDLNWGIKVPLSEATGKRLYVWFDAPIGYVSNLKEYLEKTGSKEDYIDDWFKADDVQIEHFLGKDNIIFHSVIFPIMGLGTGFMKPVEHVRANEFLNLEGKQFSKSTGWYIDAHLALNDFGADSIRLYLSSILPETGDSSFSWDTFYQSCKDFNNKVGNFVHRTFSFQYKNWPDGLSKEAYNDLEKTQTFEEIQKRIKEITEELSQCRQVKAYTKILALGQSANEFFQSQAPWKKIKEDKQAAEKTLAQSSLYVVALATLLHPYAPELAQKLRIKFEMYLKEEHFSQIYRGDLRVATSAFQQGFQLKAAPEILLPIADLEEKVRKWKEKLETLAQKI